MRECMQAADTLTKWELYAKITREACEMSYSWLQLLQIHIYIGYRFIDSCCAGVREYLRDCNCSQLKCSETMAVFAVFLDWHTKQKTGTRHIAILPASLTSFSPSLPCFSLSTWRCFSLSEDYEMHSAQWTGGVCGAYVILYRIAHDTLFMLTKKRREESEKERECCSAHINKHVIVQSVS